MFWNITTIYAVGGGYEYQMKTDVLCGGKVFYVKEKNSIQ